MIGRIVKERRRQCVYTQAAFDFAKEHSAVRFWQMEGNVVPELQRLALIVLPQPISVGAVERVWSTYGWIQSKLRNRLLPAKARKLVMVHCHLRMLRMQKEGKWEEDLLEWHEEDEMWEVREEGGEEDYDSDDEPLQTSRQRFAAGAAAASAGQ